VPRKRSPGGVAWRSPSHAWRRSGGSAPVGHPHHQIAEWIEPPQRRPRRRAGERGLRRHEETRQLAEQRGLESGEAVDDALAVDEGPQHGVPVDRGHAGRNLEHRGVVGIRLDREIHRSRRRGHVLVAEGEARVLEQEAQRETGADRPAGAGRETAVEPLHPEPGQKRPDEHDEDAETRDEADGVKWEEDGVEPAMEARTERVSTYPRLGPEGQEEGPGGQPEEHARPVALGQGPGGVTPSPALGGMASQDQEEQRHPNPGERDAREPLRPDGPAEEDHQQAQTEAPPDRPAEPALQTTRWLRRAPKPEKANAREDQGADAEKERRLGGHARRGRVVEAIRPQVKVREHVGAAKRGVLEVPLGAERSPGQTYASKVGARAGPLVQQGRRLTRLRKMVGITRP
jgi:hypothetical protein